MTNIDLLKTMTCRSNLLRKENEQFKEMLAKSKADMEYIAMMSDIDLEEGENDEQEI